MYYSDYNNLYHQDEQPIETMQYYVHGAPPVQPKKKRVGLKIAAMCLVCALVGGIAGGAGVAAVGGQLSGGGSTTLYEGTRPTAVNLSRVDQNEPMTADQIYAAYVNATVGITTEINGGINIFGQVVQNASSGSGFLVSADGYIVTNYHVIDEANAIKVTLYNGESYEAQLVGGDEENDIAVLKIDATGLTPVVIGSSDDLVVGEPAYAIGNPLGELTFSLTGGYISALDRNVTMSDGRRMNYIQTDTAINSGNSGGPLFNQYGQVVGIVSAKLSSSGSSSSASVEGLGFAIPMDNVRDMITDFIRYGYITGRPYLGIINQNVSSEAQRYGTPAGAYVLGIVEDSCAEKGGLQVGDIITALDGTAVTSSDELSDALKTHKPGDVVKLTVVRNGETTTLDISLDERTNERVQASQELQRKLQEELNQQYQQQQQQQQSGWYNFPFEW